jgi:alanyl-tRNA synthetase
VCAKPRFLFNKNNLTNALTKLLYRVTPYTWEFHANITSINGKVILLDQTCFFPRGGGQVGDIGELSGNRVIETLMAESEVQHILEESPTFSIGQAVIGRVDWNRRYRIMRLHSASHLVYYAMQEVFGLKCKPSSSGLLDDLKDRSDYLFEVPLDREKLSEVESRVNQMIERNMPITHKPENVDSERILWKIEPYDAMACGGTHVRNTGEIGRIQLRRGSKPGKGKERIELILT